MTFVVTGGSGSLGRHVVAALPGARSVSRSSGTDLVRGTGLNALRADVVVHCATSFRHEVQMARAVLDSKPAHLVYISIVGCHEVPLPYYRQKLAAERLIIDSGVAHTILRATQFHSLLHRMFDAAAKLPLMLVPGFRFQPVDEAEVGLELAALAQAPPAGKVTARVRVRTRSGAASASSWEMAPPMETPSRWKESSSRASASASASLAMSAIS